NYLFEFHCFSVENSSIAPSENIAFLSESGISVGVKTCTAQQIFSTGNEDFRLKAEVPGLTIIAGYFVIILTILIMIHVFKSDGPAPIVYGIFGAGISFVMERRILRKT
ncbi:unnamed protein product, partial [marine sediment metagenome]